MGTYGNERVKCYYEYNRLELDNHLPAVYKQIVFAGRTSHRSHRKQNRGSLVANQKLLVSRRNKTNLKHFWLLRGYFLLFNKVFFSQQFQFKTCFFFYNILALFVLIPPNWKKLFKEDSFDPVSLSISIHSLTCRIIYSLLLNHEDQPPPTSEEKRRASGVAKKALAKI